MSVLVIASLLFWLFSGLVITIPAALAGAFAAVSGLVRPSPGDTMFRFWHGFRRCFLPATLLGVLDLVVFASAYLGVRLFWEMGSPVSKAVAVIYGSLAMLAVMVNVFVWPLLVWYPQPFTSLIRRAFFLAGAHPFQTLGALAAALLALWLLTLLPGPLLGFLPALGPGLAVTMISYVAWHTMKRYAPPDDEIPE